jgi:hypothetical protein
MFGLFRSRGGRREKRRTGRGWRPYSRSKSGRTTSHSESIEWFVEDKAVLRSYQGLQTDVVYLGWPIAPSYMSPSAGGGGELRGLSQWVQLYTGAQITHEPYGRLLTQPTPFGKLSLFLSHPVCCRSRLLTRGGRGGQGPNYKTTRINPILFLPITWSQQVATPKLGDARSKIFKMRRSYCRSERISYRGRNPHKILKSFHHCFYSQSHLLYNFALRFIFLQIHATSYSFQSNTIKETGGKPDRKPYPLPHTVV